MTRTARKARSVWLGGRPEDVVTKLSDRINDPNATFPDIEAFLAAYEGNAESAIRKDSRIGEPLDEGFFDEISKLLLEIDETHPIPVPLRVHITASVSMTNTDWRHWVTIQLKVAPESWRTLRTYNQLRDLRVQGAMRPVVISENAGRFNIIVPKPIGWEDDPFDLEPQP